MTRTQIALSDGQRAQVNAAAATLRYDHRGIFICDTMNMLEARCHSRSITNADVSAAIEAALGVTPTSLFMCDGVSLTKQEATTMSNFDPTMARKVRDQLDDENFETLPDGRQVLRDKGVMRTRMAAMDSADAAQRAAAEGHYARRFGLPDAADLRRPGFRLQPDATARDAKLQAYDAYEKHLATAYLSPHAENTGVGSQGPRETRSVGDRCLIQGQNGHLYEADDGSLVCVPDSWGDSALSERAIEHARYIDQITNAWRNPGGDVVSDRGPTRRADAALTRDEAYQQYEKDLVEAYRSVKP